MIVPERDASSVFEMLGCNCFPIPGVSSVLGLHITSKPL